ncbi:YnjH family protein [Vibrio kasasachensis]|uniref:DUF1496 domain-containing protein n=1 Tax=Vibrio kasasachensis TaxID=2910248 RepID=UPI003D0E0770
MKAVLILWLSFFSLVGFASEKSYSTPNRAAIVVDAENINHRVCYYQDKAFSLGALLEVGGYLLRCEEANNFESNGRLKWVAFGKTETTQTQDEQ